MGNRSGTPTPSSQAPSHQETFLHAQEWEVVNEEEEAYEVEKRVLKYLMEIFPDLGKQRLLNTIFSKRFRRHRYLGEGVLLERCYLELENGNTISDLEVDDFDAGAFAGVEPDKQEDRENSTAKETNELELGTDRNTNEAQTAAHAPTSPDAAPPAPTSSASKSRPPTPRPSSSSNAKDLYSQSTYTAPTVDYRSRLQQGQNRQKTTTRPETRFIPDENREMETDQSNDRVHISTQFSQLPIPTLADGIDQEPYFGTSNAADNQEVPDGSVIRERRALKISADQQNEISPGKTGKIEADLMPKSQQPASFSNIDKNQLPGTSNSEMSLLENRELGNEKFRAGQYGEALKLYSIALTAEDGTDHDKAVVYRNRAMCYLKLGNYQSALEDAVACLEVQPDDTKALYRKSSANEGLGNFTDAYKDAKSCTKLDPANNDFKILLRRLEDKARSTLSPREAGNLLYNEEEYAKAVSCYTEALTGSDIAVGDRAVIYRNRAQCYWKLKDYRLSVDDCTKCLELLPNDEKALHRRFYAYQSLGQYEDAYRDAKFHSEINPTDENVAEKLKAIKKKVFSQPPLVVVAIDLGTTFSGWAYSKKEDFDLKPLRIWKHEWRGDALMANKAPSCVLLTPDGNSLEAFGFEAEDRFSKLVHEKRQDQFLFVKHFNIEASKENIDESLDSLILTDVYGTQLPAKKVFIMVVKFFMKHFWTESSKKLLGSEIKQEHIQWVLTTSCFRDKSGEDFLRNIALEAGIAEERLQLAMEPSVASVYCSYKIRENREHLFATGAKHLIVDAGGGSLGMAIYEVAESGVLQKVHLSRVRAHGATGVDSAFENLCSKLFGVDIYSNFRMQYKGDYITMMRKFEINKRKLPSDLNSPQTFYISSRLNEHFQNLSQRTIGKKMKVEDVIKSTQFTDMVKFQGDKIRVSPEIVMHMFNETIENILKCIHDVLENQSSGNVKTVILIGGFSDSNIFQNSVKRRFPDYTIITPDEAGLVSLNGSVILGHTGEASVRHLHINKQDI